jgi:hypothetical protein
MSYISVRLQLNNSRTLRCRVRKLLLCRKWHTPVTVSSRRRLTRDPRLLRYPPPSVFVSRRLPPKPERVAQQRVSQGIDVNGRRAHKSVATINSTAIPLPVRAPPCSGAANP